MLGGLERQGRSILGTVGAAHRRVLDRTGLDLDVDDSAADLEYRNILVFLLLFPTIRLVSSMPSPQIGKTGYKATDVTSAV